MNILVLTSVYPSTESISGFTPVVHYFTKEWVKKGHNVKVIHNQSKFYFFLYLVPKFVKSFFESKYGFTFPIYKMSSNKRFKKDFVNIHRIPIFKGFPFLNFKKSILKRQATKIFESNELDEFIPEIIIAHWTSQIQIMNLLKQSYSCKTVLVLHGMEYFDSISSDKAHKLLKKIDYIGFRSEGIKKCFKNLIGLPEKYFLCYSGIKDEYLNNFTNKKFNTRVQNFLFVGMLIKRKHVDKIIKMISLMEYDSRLEIVGVGPEKKILEKSVIKCGIMNRVKFHNQIERDEILNKMEKAECFVMISSGEAFGLVYLEAMAKGCIVIASRNEGMDGIINDKENGFLCEAGNYLELGLIIDHINSLTIQKRHQISQKAYQTAFNLKESKVAQDYLDFITS